MSMNPAGKGKRKLRPLPREVRAHAALERARIRKSMLKWEGMDTAARYLGRGLGRDELIDRVAQEVGTSLRQVRAALRA